MWSRLLRKYMCVMVLSYNKWWYTSISLLLYLSASNSHSICGNKTQIIHGQRTLLPQTIMVWISLRFPCHILNRLAWPHLDSSYRLLSSSETFHNFNYWAGHLWPNVFFPDWQHYLSMYNMYMLYVVAGIYFLGLSKHEGLVWYGLYICELDLYK